MTLARRMWLASAALALLVGAAFTALILAVSAQREAADRETRSKDVTAASLQLERLVSDVESSFLSFTITGKDGTLETYRSAIDKLPGQLRVVARLVKDDPIQSRRALAIENQIREYAFAFVPQLVRAPAGRHRGSAATTPPSHRTASCRRTRSGGSSASFGRTRTSSPPRRPATRTSAPTSPCSSALSPSAPRWP